MQNSSTELAPRGQRRPVRIGRGRRLVAGIAAVGLIAVGFVAMAVVPASAETSAGFALGDLNLQNGWDGGIVGGNPVPFTNNNADSNVVTDVDAYSGTQSWRYSGGYNSPGAGTPFSPDVATVGAPNATTAGSPITPAGDQSVISFAFRAVVPGDGSRINVYEGSHARNDRTGGSLYLQNDSGNGNPAGTVSLYNFFSLIDAGVCTTPLQVLGYVTAGAWHTVEMTSVYPDVVVGDGSTFGSTTYVFDKGTVDEQSATMQSWAHPWRDCNGLDYTPGGSTKWANSFNDYPTHQGYYIDDVAMTVIDTTTDDIVGSYLTSFENLLLVQDPLTVNATSPAENGTTQTLTTSGGSGDGAVTYDVGSSTACSVTGDQLTITSGSGTCDVTATKAGDTLYGSVTSDPVDVAVEGTSTTVSISNIPGGGVFGGSFTPEYAYTGDGTTSTTSSTPTTCTVSGPDVNFVGVGTCTLVAHANAGTNYAAATGAPQSFSISQLAPSISINNIPGGAQFGGSFTPTYNYAGDGTTSVTTNTPTKCQVSGANVNFIGIGTCTLVAHATATANSAAANGTPQSFSITKATPTVSINNIPGDAKYAGTFKPIFDYSGNGKTWATSSTVGICKVVGANVNFVGIGTCTLVAHSGATANYAAATGAPQSFPVTQATPTINIKNIPGSPKFGGAFQPAYNYTGNGAKSVTSNTPSTCTVAGAKVNFVGVGICTLVAHAAATTNYAAATGDPQSFTIGKGVATVRVANIPGTAKKGKQFKPTYAYTGDGTTSVTSSTPGTCTIVLDAVRFVNVGTCTLVAHATETANFTAATGPNQSFSITP